MAKIQKSVKSDKCAVGGVVAAYCMWCGNGPTSRECVACRGKHHTPVEPFNECVHEGKETAVPATTAIPADSGPVLVKQAPNGAVKTRKPRVKKAPVFDIGTECFAWDHTTKTFRADLSATGFPEFPATLRVKSARTGNVRLFVKTTEERNDYRLLAVHYLSVVSGEMSLNLILANE